MADNQFIPYTTTGKTRWDAVSVWAYGTPFLLTPLIEANPTLLINVPIPSGATILVPIYDDSTATQLQASSKPPWA